MQHAVYLLHAAPIGIRHISQDTDTIYSYVKNLQGDIMMIIDSAGRLLHKPDPIGSTKSVDLDFDSNQGWYDIFTLWGNISWYGSI